MRRIAILVSILIGGAGFAPVARAQTVAAQIDAILARANVSANTWSMAAESDDGTVVYYLNNSTTTKAPASNMKIVTSAAAFALLGTTNYFVSLAYGNGTITSGVLNGDLNLLVKHDITWNDTVFSSARAPLDYIAAQLTNQGITSIHGNVQIYGACMYNKGESDDTRSLGNQVTYNTEGAVAFVAALQAKGITVTGSGLGQSGFSPPGTLLYTYKSTSLTYGGSPLRLDIACIPMAKVSHNVMADLLLRHIAYELNGSDSFTTGKNLVFNWLSGTVGLNTSDMVMNDGSGLSGSDRFSAHEILTIVRYMLGHYSTWSTILPIGCVDGTIGGRFCGTDGSGRVHAKTGSLNSSIDLSGYVDNKYDHHRYLFSFLSNASGIDQTATRQAVDDAANVLAASSVIGDGFLNYGFDTSAQGWTSAHGLSTTAWTDCCGWPGIIYADQTGNDGFFYSPSVSFIGPTNSSVNVNILIQSNAAPHDMQVFWKTTADNVYTASKSTPTVQYTSQNVWARLNLDCNSPLWSGQTVNQLRLDVDDIRHTNRFLIDHVVAQTTPRYTFDASVQGWFLGNGLSGLSWTASGWPGIMYADQTANDCYYYGPSGMSFWGANNDRVHVRVYPQGGSSGGLHDAQLFWITTADGTWNDTKSSGIITFYGNDQFIDIYFNVGLNTYWNGNNNGGGNGGAVNQLRLDFDNVNHGVRWIVDSVQIEHVNFDLPFITTQPTGQTTTAGGQAAFTVTGNGGNSGLSYQWFKIATNGATLIAGATSSSLTVSNALPGGATNYLVTVSNQASSINSSTAPLTIIPNDILVITNNLWQATWSLAGPLSRSGSGLGTTISNVPAGNYTLTWNNVQFYQTPVVQTNAHISGLPTLFNAVYTMVDTNLNGIPDSWEQLRFGVVSTNRTATTDTDGDGMTDYAEFIAGTDARFDTSVFKLTAVPTVTNNVFQLQWPSALGRAYRVFGSTNGTAWLPLSGWLTGGVHQYSVTNQPSAPLSLFRVLVQP